MGGLTVKLFLFLFCLFLFCLFFPLAATSAPLQVEVASAGSVNLSFFGFEERLLFFPSVTTELATQRDA